MSSADKILKNCQIIGNGSYGVVYKGIDDDGKEWSFKRRYALYTEELKGISFLGEMFLSTVFTHKNLLHAESVQWINPDVNSNIKSSSIMNEDPAAKKTSSSYRSDPGYIITEVAKHDLRHALESDTKLSDDMIVSYICDILSGVAYIHAYGFIHRDIKPDNILVFDDGLKVCDFDMVIPAINAKGTLLMTPGYVPPEIISQTSSSVIAYSQANDMWCVGLVLLCMIIGRVFVTSIPDLADVESKYLSRFYELLLKRDLVFGLPRDRDEELGSLVSEIETDLVGRPKLRELLFKLLDPNPSTRITASDALKFLDVTPDKELIIPDKIRGLQFYQNYEMDRLELMSDDVKMFITEYFDTMMKSNPSQLWINGFFLGLDLLCRVEGGERPINDDYPRITRSVANVIINMGIKFFTKDTFTSHNYESMTHNEVITVEYKVLHSVKFEVYRPLLIEYFPSDPRKIFNLIINREYNQYITFVDLVLELKQAQV